MSKTFTTFSQLTKAILKKEESPVRKPAPVQPPIPHPVKAVPSAQTPPSDSALSRADAECLAYFSHTSLTDKRFATAGRTCTPVVPVRKKESAVVGDAPAADEVASLKRQLEAAEARASEAEARAVASERTLDAQCNRMKSESDHLARLEAELRSLRTQIAEKPRVAVSPAPSPMPVPQPVVPNPSRLLERPAGFDEAFPGEVREMVVAALRDACETARQSTRDRRAFVLEAVLKANPSSGELERRRSELRQVVKDAANSNDEYMLKELEKLGMKLISGRKHWKLEYGNVRMPMSKTPSDYRSGLNSSADMANRCF